MKTKRVLYLFLAFAMLIPLLPVFGGMPAGAADYDDSLIAHFQPA